MRPRAPSLSGMLRAGGRADRLPPGPDSGSFWAFVTGMGFETPDHRNAGASDVRMAYSFLRVVPCANAEAYVWLAIRD